MIHFLSFPLNDTFLRIYPRYANAGCERKDKKFYVIKFCPINFFESFAPLDSHKGVARGGPRSTCWLALL